MNAGAVALGAALLAVSGLLLRYRAEVADWQINSRIETLRRSSLSNSEYVEREVQSLRRPESKRLSRWLVVLVAVLVAVCGVVALTHGLRHA